jgi:hypothetical protein
MFKLFLALKYMLYGVDDRISFHQLYISKYACAFSDDSDV